MAGTADTQNTNPMELLTKVLEFAGISQSPQTSMPVMSPAPNTQSITNLLNQNSTNMINTTGAQQSPVIPGQTGGEQSWFGGAFGGKDAWGMDAANAAAGLLQAMVGWQSVNESARQFDESFAFNKWQANNQVQNINTRFADRQAARIAADGNRGNYQSVSDYMKENGVKAYG